MAKTIKEYIGNLTEWKPSILKLQALVLSAGLDESIKWGAPTYSYKSKNVLGIAAFKRHTCIWFFHGTFLEDKSNKLNISLKTTTAMRQWRFESLESIEKDSDLILTYVKEAIENEIQGKRITRQKNASPILVPKELQLRLNQDKTLTEHFNKLTPSNQREYCTHIADAKRDATKQNRLEKIIPMIKAQKGLNDKYKR